MLNLSNHSSVVIGVEAAPVIQILDLFNPSPFLIKFLNTVFNNGIIKIIFIKFCGNFDKSLDLNFAYILGTPKKDCRFTKL